MSEEEVEAVVKQLITDTGAAGMKDMGKVMGAATKQLAGQADGKIVSAVVKKLLS
ncbi:Yqey-like protein [compost metagenome]